jgi:hypothetical protein
MPSVGAQRWLCAAAVSTTLGAAAVVTGLATPLAEDHLGGLVALVALAAIARASTSGGPRSVATLAGVTLASQPLLHVLSEATHGAEHALSGLEGLLSLVQVISHLLLLATVLAIVGTTERVCRLAIVAALRRLARVLTSPVLPIIGAEAPGVRCETDELSHQQRLCAPEPPRRGPPSTSVLSLS